jgi:hypothetical protein
MTFMIIERFKNGDAAPVYRRFGERGRMLPDGLKYIDSWVDHANARCFQLMECDDERLLEEWTAHWSDLVDFEIVRVMSSKEAADKQPGRA